MSIPAVCPSCNASYQLAETMQGKRVRCKSCTETFVVRKKTPAPDGDEDEARIQASPRPAKRVARYEEDEDWEQPQPRRRPRKERGNALPLIIGACIALGILVLGLGGLAVWAITRSRQPQPPPLAANANRPAFVPQPAQAPPQQEAPPVQNPMPAQGPLAAQLTNAKISGFGARMQVTADYRFTSGNPAGRRIYLFIKATKAMGFIQKENYYVAELHSIGNRTQGTINAAGMTFGIEQGPFQMWLGEGAGVFGPMIAEKDLRKISNVVTVETKDSGIPGVPGIPGRPPGMPGIPGRPPGFPGRPPGFPGPRPPFGPRGMGGP